MMTESQKERKNTKDSSSSGLWGLAKNTGLLSRQKKKVSLVRSSQTDVLYIACHSILQEYWGVAELKPGSYSNPSPTFTEGDLISVLVANIPAAWAAYNREPVQGCYKHTAHLCHPHFAVDCFSLTSKHLQKQK